MSCFLGGNKDCKTWKKLWLFFFSKKLKTHFLVYSFEPGLIWHLNIEDNEKIAFFIWMLILGHTFAAHDDGVAWFDDFPRWTADFYTSRVSNYAVIASISATAYPRPSRWVINILEKPVIKCTTRQKTLFIKKSIETDPVVPLREILQQ